jgi:molecular chaperone Hsp33
MNKAELYKIIDERDVIEVDCEFCREHYSYDAVDVENLFSQEVTIPPSQTRH